MDMQRTHLSIQHVLHGTTDGVTIDSRTNQRVVFINVLIVSQRDVVNREEERGTLWSCTNPRKEETHALGSKWMWTRKISFYVLIEGTSKANN